MKKRALFINRNGTLIAETSDALPINTLEQLELLPGVIRNLYFICKHLDFDLHMINNDSGPIQDKLLQLFANEDIAFMNADYRRTDAYELRRSYVIGNKQTDIEFAEALGSKTICFNPGGVRGFSDDKELFTATCWDEITEYLFAGERTATVHHITKETNIFVHLNLDGHGKTAISTGIGFFDHLLEQIGKHAAIDLTIKSKGDLHVDEHHTIEDTAIALGEAIRKALGNKRGIERYGFCLPMDDCLCSVVLDFGGRAWLTYDVNFTRDKIGDMPTEMFMHFFKSFSDAARMNLNIKAKGNNSHHKAESIFKALAKAIKMAIKRDIYKYELPSTKGRL